jgi:hypothetical protein
MRHPDGKYTPRCGNMVREEWMDWLSKEGCLSGNQPPKKWVPQFHAFFQTNITLD